MGVHREVEHRAAITACDLRVLAGTVDDEDLVFRVGEDRAGHLLLNEHTLAAAGLSANEPHRTGEVLSVAEH